MSVSEQERERIARERIGAFVAGAPPLTDETKAALAAILQPVMRRRRARLAEERAVARLAARQVAA